MHPANVLTLEGPGSITSQVSIILNASIRIIPLSYSPQIYSDLGFGETVDESETMPGRPICSSHSTMVQYRLAWRY